MKERGMIFNGEMVRALLDGRKTQTRRPVKFPLIDKNMGCELAGNELAGELAEGNYWNSPFGKPGDRIWVRETWAEAGAGAPDLKLYRANYPEHVPTHYENVPPADEIRWTPSIHMPRAACRILLEVTGVRVERLNGISETDAESEGIDMEALYDSQDCYDCIADHNMTGRPTVTGAFKYLWESIYGEGSWHANPWVWVIEFKVVPNVPANSTGSDLR
ncbi:MULTISPECIES: morphogenetic protein [Enterobacter]|uniref:Morphogenetic protein n=1 Tax=Enterobacter intestinihominis TaxID=3133180 RepID=A0ABV1ZEN4_9ENTR|nr:morphogenetic protein [Enterobacter hormaechei]QLU72602.1 morphogenetic protein [Enterobacter cloacae]QLU92791.1 morphogenetic protein [Enterobacter roggenkampii]TYF80235.1 morphogenetic protein [Klebsiella quasipneumoniae]TYF78867.1 morphogenetic protein [Enterobacter hormaechei]HCT8090588.1 morphogenetic protein [Enterobacter hormaechei]